MNLAAQRIQREKTHVKASQYQVDNRREYARELSQVSLIMQRCASRLRSTYAQYADAIDYARAETYV